MADDFNTRFISLRDEFETAIMDARKQREIVRNRAALRAAGMNGDKHVGDKWGGKYLRAPAIYHYIIDQHRGKFVRLGDVALVKRGVITGANRFFFLSEEDIRQWGIEDKFLQQAMTTPQESNSIAVSAVGLPYRAFICHENKNHLSGTKALEYIEWGEERGFHRKSAPAARRLWYDLGSRDVSQTAINIFVSSTARTFLASRPVLFSDNFQIIQAHESDLARLCSSMNSSLCQLFINVDGRTNFGQGVLEIQTYETANLQIVNPELLPEPAASVFNAADWDVLTPSAARRYIDEAVFGTLGLTAGEREAVYEGVAELIGNRRRRARSMGGTANDGARVEDKPPFKIVPNRGGYAPGVNDNNLMDVIRDWEDKEFLEKLNQ